MALMWLWWSSLGLVALTSHARCTVQHRHQRLQTCLCLWFQLHHKYNSPGRDSADETWGEKRRNSLLIQSDFDCGSSSSEHCLFQNSFLSSDIKEFFGESSHPLHLLIKKMFQINWIIKVGKVITT